MMNSTLNVFDGVKIAIRQRDGYCDATAMCRASNKLFGDYWRLDATQAFIHELSTDMGIPISALAQIQKGGHDRSTQGTWIHPYVAINLGQWCSPRFAVFVSKLVTEWLSGYGDRTQQRLQQLESQLDELKKRLAIVPATKIVYMPSMKLTKEHILEVANGIHLEACADSRMPVIAVWCQIEAYYLRKGSLFINGSDRIWTADHGCIKGSNQVYEAIKMIIPSIKRISLGSNRKGIQGITIKH